MSLFISNVWFRLQTWWNYEEGDFIGHTLLEKIRTRYTDHNAEDI